MKKTNQKAIRTLAAGLAAAMTMTTASSIAVSANNTQAVNNMRVSSAMDNSKVYDQLIDLELEELFKCLDELVPGGKFLTPVFKLVSNNILGKNSTVSLSDINAKLNDMFSKLDKLNADLKNSIETITAMQNFDSFHLTTFNSQIGEIISQIETIRKMDVPEESKYAQIAALVDDNTSWTKANNVFVTFSNVTQALNRSGITANGDFFELLYSHYSKTSMFSGEAIDKASFAADLVMTDYMAGYYALMQCLSAQTKVCNMTAEQKSRIEPKYLSKICDNQQFITNKINQLKDCVLGNTTVRTERYITGYRTADNIPDGCTVTDSIFGNKKVPVYATGPVVKYDSDSIAGKYNRFKTTDRLIFINYGTANDKLSEDLKVINHDSIPLDLDNKARALEVSTNYINENIRPMKLSGDKIKFLAYTALSQGLTVRQYLKKNGFNVDGLPAHSVLITSRAYNDLGVVDYLTSIYGFASAHACYKGIDIDSILVCEREITFHHVGLNKLASEDWNFIESGNIVSFSTGENTSWDWLINPVIC